jgi:acylphosphatase
LIISGRVQGVWFRAKTQKTAIALGVCGWVRNLPDGTVEALVEGRQDQVDALVAWCHQGPSMARVSDLKVSRQDFQGTLSGFTIR